MISKKQFAKAYREGLNSTRKFLMSLGVPAGRAEESAQAAWARGWEQRHQLRKPERIVSWINRIGLNLFRNALRRERPSEEPTDIAAPPAVSIEAIQVRRWLGKCSPADRKLLRAYYLEGYTSDELAEVYGCSAEAIRVRVWRAKHRLFEHIDAVDDLRAAA